MLNINIQGDSFLQILQNKQMKILKNNNSRLCFSSSFQKIILVLFVFLYVVSSGKFISTQVMYKNQSKQILPKKNTKQCLVQPPQFFVMDQSYSTLKIKADYEFYVVLDYKNEKVRITGIGLSKQQQIHAKDKKNQQNISKVYSTNMQIYAKCLSRDVSYNEVSIPVQLIPKTVSTQSLELLTKKQKQKVKLNDNQSQSQSQIQSLNFNTPSIEPQKAQTVQINAIVYCVSDYSIIQSNLFIKDLYATFIMFIFGFLLQFKAQQNLHILARTIHICVYIVASFFMKDWMPVVLAAYAGLFWFAIYFKKEAAYIVLLKSIWSITFPISILTIFDPDSGAHQKIPEGFTLYLINFCVMANNVMIVSGLINLRRLRHIVYYMLFLGMFQFFGWQLAKNNFVFQLVYPKLIPIDCNTQPIFFIIMIIPVCDYFFESYSPRRLLKFFVMIIPILSPIQVSVTLICSLICTIWFIFESISAGSCIKLIKFRK